jgi:two-component system phosphate regulon response regulator PhoB
MPTILLVDDVAQIRDLVSMFLTEEGFQVLAFGSCEEALAYLATNRPDVVILDGRLPGMSGWECRARLRAAEETARLPILMMTAAPRDGQQYLCGEADECTRCLDKPFDLDQLLDAITEILDACRQRLVSA